MRIVPAVAMAGDRLVFTCRAVGVDCEASVAANAAPWLDVVSIRVPRQRPPCATLLAAGVGFHARMMSSAATKQQPAANMLSLDAGPSRNTPKIKLSTQRIINNTIITSTLSSGCQKPLYRADYTQSNSNYQGANRESSSHAEESGGYAAR